MINKNVSKLHLNNQ